ncbi:MAG: type IV pilus secretin PilQ [Deltaproteobacteria bacterium]|nr:type IV pilus secretin PilQ [Deltaproteobacteria bacterium]
MPADRLIRHIFSCQTASFVIFFLCVALCCRAASGPETKASYGRASIAGAASNGFFTIEVRDAEISDVLRALAQQADMNIIIGEGVSGKVTLSLRDIAFKDALEMVIKANGLMYTIRNNVFWVGRKVDNSGEFVIEMVPLNYSDPASAVAYVKGALSEGGTAMSDPRMNSVIVRDLPANVGAAKALLAAMDAQTPQVVIEARIVEASNSFSRNLGIRWGGRYASGRDVATGGSDLPASPGGRNFAVNLPADAPSSGLGLILGNVTNKLFLDAELSAAETRGELRIISRPKIATLNKKPAAIHSGLTFRVKVNQASATATAAATAAGQTTTGLEEIKTGIDLTVTPQISNDDYVLLNIATNKSDPDYSHTVDNIPGVSEKSASTVVLVKNGETVVIGGLYKSTTSDQDNAVPFLETIPVLGVLFKGNAKRVENEELLVFITPTIVKYGKNTEVLN